MANMYVLPKPVKLHPDLALCFGDVNQDVYAARVVKQITSKGRHQRRVLVITVDKIFLCETNGTVRRMVGIEDISDAMINSTRQEVLVNVRSEHDPSLLYIEEDHDPRNKESPTALEAMKALYAHKRHSHMAVSECPNQSQSLAVLARFQKGEGYQSPRRQLLQYSAHRGHAVYTEDDVISPSPTESDVSQHCDSPAHVPRRNFSAANKAKSPYASNRDGQGQGDLDKQLAELRLRMQRQEQELETLREQNHRLETAADWSRGAVQRSGLGGGFPPPRDPDSDAVSPPIPKSTIEREIEELQRRHVQAEEGERARRQAAQNDMLLQSPQRGRESPRFVVLRPDQVPPAALASARSTSQGQSARFVAVPSPPRNRPEPQTDAGDAFAELQAAQDRNRQLETRNKLLESQLRTATETTEKLRSKDRSLRREQRRQERRRREVEATTNMEETKLQIKSIMARVEDFEKRNWEMAQAIQRVAPSPDYQSPLPLPDRAVASSDFFSQWTCASGALPADGQLRTPLPRRVAAPVPDLHTYLETLRDLQRRGAPGLGPAISQLEYQTGV